MLILLYSPTMCMPVCVEVTTNIANNSNNNNNNNVISINDIAFLFYIL